MSTHSRTASSSPSTAHNSHQALDSAFQLRGSYAPRDPAEAAQFGVKVIEMDIPRPPKMKMIDVGSNGHKPPGENNEDD